MISIKPNETVISGNWIFEGGDPKEDENCARIRTLVAEELREVGHHKSGWDVLFVDPQDNRLWELMFPASEVHGGGPPTLTWIPEDHAKLKYAGLARDLRKLSHGTKKRLS